MNNRFPRISGSNDKVVNGGPGDGSRGPGTVLCLICKLYSKNIRFGIIQYSNHSFQILKMIFYRLQNQMSKIIV